LALWGKRSGQTEAERAKLPNVVTVADQHNDALVYELSGLAEDEIRLVEWSEEC
jgi:hypothetical protein